MAFLKLYDEDKSNQISCCPLDTHEHIFKNYYANTQEDKFYTIGSGRRFTIAINDVTYPITDINKTLQIGDVIRFTPTPTKEEQGNLIFIGSENSRYRRWKGSDIGAWTAQNEFKISGLKEGREYELDKIFNELSVGLQQWELESLDTLRDNILTTKGNVTFSVTGIDSVPVLQQFNERYGSDSGHLKTTGAQFGLALKTYNSDLYQNWINTDWIEGVNGINEISPVDVSDGSLAMDAELTAAR